MRTRQTWDLVAAAMPTNKPVVEHVDELYGAGLEELVVVIRDAAVQDPRRLMLIGHNPSLHEMALGLIKDGSSGGDAAARRALSENLPTGSIAVIDFAIDSWNDVAFRSGTLTSFMSPKLLKDPGR
jgi:phosphohistidine phosphatase